jgi:Flp pilus assembly protein TadG
MARTRRNRTRIIFANRRARLPGARQRHAFLADRRGAVALIFALASTVLLGLAGGGIDYTRMVYRRSQMQNAVDAAVLAGGNTLKLSPSNSTAVASIVQRLIAENAPSPPDRPLSVQVTVSSDKTSVSASATDTFKLAFGAFVGLKTSPITVRSTARIMGKMRLCLLTLDPGAVGTLHLETNANLSATSCSLYADSSSPQAIQGDNNAIAKADTICSVGGSNTARANFAPPVTSGCPSITDPLTGAITAPAPGACVSVSPAAGPGPGKGPGGPAAGNVAITASTTLDPGTYCGGLHISGSASVTLNPGVYIIKDGPLIVDGQASMTGQDVGFYFMGDAAGLRFDANTTISLTAPVSGPLAGFLMAEQPTVSAPVPPPPGPAGSPPAPPGPPSKPLREYRIISNNARTMLGTIYLPAGRLIIDGSAAVSDQSAYTVIVVQLLDLYDGPTLYLNANYDATSVPVPKGVGPLNGKILLTQ